jgi:uncharacterized membrane protein YwaF
MYLLVAMRFRPRWEDFRTAVAASLIYAAVVIGLDAAFGWNYGFLGKELLRTRNVLDYLGPWPVRPALISLLGLVMLAALYGAWLIPPLKWCRETPAVTGLSRS